MVSRAWRGLALFAVGILGAAACISPTDAPPGLVSVSGVWNFSSVESGRPNSTIGTLTLSQDATVRFTGTLDASETDDRGQVRRIIAIVSGRTIDSTLVDFDLVLDPSTTRRHSATLRGDSLAGSWVQVSNAGGALSGTFHARRIRAK